MLNNYLSYTLTMEVLISSVQVARGLFCVFVCVCVCVWGGGGGGGGGGMGDILCSLDNFVGLPTHNIIIYITCLDKGEEWLYSQRRRENW